MKQLHNYGISKNASEILDSNNTTSPFTLVNDVIQPTIEISPKQLIRSAQIAGAMYTTPTDKDFYLTSMHISAGFDYGASASSGNASIDFFDTEGLNHSIAIVVPSNSDGIGGNTSICNDTFITFPGRGIKLSRGSAITLSYAASVNAYAHFTGYLE